MNQVQRALFVGGAVGLALVALYIVTRTAGGAARDIASGTIDALDGTVGGIGEGIAGVFGVPPTDDGECLRALADGRWWDASFSCPAKRFLQGIFS